MKKVACIKLVGLIQQVQIFLQFLCYLKDIAKLLGCRIKLQGESCKIKVFLLFLHFKPVHMAALPLWLTSRIVTQQRLVWQNLILIGQDLVFYFAWKNVVSAIRSQMCSKFVLDAFTLVLSGSNLASSNFIPNCLVRKISPPSKNFQMKGMPPASQFLQLNIRLTPVWLNLSELL